MATASNDAPHSETLQNISLFAGFGEIETGSRGFVFVPGPVSRAK